MTEEGDREPRCSEETGPAVGEGMEVDQEPGLKRRKVRGASGAASMAAVAPSNGFQFH